MDRPQSPVGLLEFSTTQGLHPCVAFVRHPQVVHVASDLADVGPGITEGGEAVHTGHSVEATHRAVVAQDDFAIPLGEDRAERSPQFLERAGELASQIFVETAVAIWQTAGELSEQDRVERVQYTFAETNKRILAHVRDNPLHEGMGCTGELITFFGTGFVIGHIGDSRIYYLPKNGQIAQLTRDDTHVGWLFRKGDLNEREARTHPRRSALEQALGASTQFIDPQIGAVGLQDGDRFLICSDGLIDGLWDRHIEEHLTCEGEKSLDPGISDLLVATAVENSGKDNTTALVIEVQRRGDA